MDAIPFTERSNAITENIDVSEAIDMVQLFRATDEQIFNGVNEENLFNSKTVEAITEVSNVINAVLLHPVEDVAIVLAGCGTSGRLAFLTAKICNQVIRNLTPHPQISGGPFYYSIAGGDKSILTSQEAPEDDPFAGRDSLLKICEGKQTVVYIAITCGISAPFVAGQLDYCMQHLDVFTPVLIGFNPVSMARNVRISGWNKTVREVAIALDRLSEERKGFLINPIIGGEAITGSSRMKGGSATKIILDTMMFTAINATCPGGSNSEAGRISTNDIVDILHQYKAVCGKFYESDVCGVMSKLIDQCGTSLKEGGHVRYLASGWPGVLALIDSTECPPTFGSSVNDIRCFLIGGYDVLEMENFGLENDYLKLGFDDFFNMCKSTEVTNAQDTVIVFVQSQSDPVLKRLLENDAAYLKMLKTSGRYVVAVLLETNKDQSIDFTHMETGFHQILRFHLPILDETSYSNWNLNCKNVLNESIHSCCFKWLLNAVSTGAHVKLGKVFKNYMCDVKVSNNKLYYRAIGIIQKLCSGISYEKARGCLLKSIYETDQLKAAIENAPVNDHLESASPKDKVVPLAIILGTLDCSIEVAKGMLMKYNVVRNALLEAARK